MSYLEESDLVLSPRERSLKFITSSLAVLFMIKKKNINVLNVKVRVRTTSHSIIHPEIALAYKDKTLKIFMIPTRKCLALNSRVKFYYIPATLLAHIPCEIPT